MVFQKYPWWSKVFIKSPTLLKRGSDAFLVFDRDVYQLNLSELATLRNSKEQLRRKFPKKYAYGELLFSKAATCLVSAWNFNLG